MLAPPRRRRGGFTLTELMFATGIFALLILGVVGIYIASLRLGVSVISDSSSSSDAANATQHVVNDLREAQNFELMDGTGQVDGTAFGTAYDATDSNGNTVVAGIRIFAPGRYAYPSSDPAYGNTIQVKTSATRTITLSGTSAPWDHNQVGTSLDIYRADYQKTGVADGTVDPSAGAALWAKGTDNGVTVNKPIIKSISPTVDAVQFIQPYDSTTGKPLTNEVKIKITCAAYAPTHGEASSDSSAGGTCQITGECTYMRDHNPASTGSTDTNGRSQYGGS